MWKLFAIFGLNVILHPKSKVMYSAPEAKNPEEWAMPLDKEEQKMSKGQCVFPSYLLHDENISDLCMIPVIDLDFQLPSKALLKVLICMSL